MGQKTTNTLIQSFLFISVGKLKKDMLAKYSPDFSTNCSLCKEGNVK